MEYFVKRVDVLEWTGINRAELVHTGWLEPEPIRAWAQLCHDGENLYVRMEAEETPVRATLTGVLDELRSDDLPLLLRIADSGQLVQKAVHCIYVNQICPQLMAEHLNHLFRFALPQKAMVDVNTGELASHRPMSSAATN